jgi:hypothetical protein
MQTYQSSEQPLVPICVDQECAMHLMSLDAMYLYRVDGVTIKRCLHLQSFQGKQPGFLRTAVG